MNPKLIRVNFICPVCQGLTVTQPVLAEDGFIYHHLCIKEYIDSKNGKLSSPMRGIVYGSTLVTLKAFKPTIKMLETCEEPINDNVQHDARIEDTIIKAKLGDPHHMTTLGRWHLFGEQEGVERDVSYGFKLVENAHEEGYIEATAYYGHCLIRGLGTEKNKTDGYEALVDAHSEGSGAGKGVYWCAVFSNNVSLTKFTSLPDYATQTLQHTLSVFVTEEACTDLRMTRRRLQGGFQK